MPEQFEPTHPEPNVWIDEVEWGRALDPSLPPGVIALCDTNGKWWRYPLAEFPAADLLTGGGA